MKARFSRRSGLTTPIAVRDAAVRRKSFRAEASPLRGATLSTGSRNRASNRTLSGWSSVGGFTGVPYAPASAEQVPLGGADERAGMALAGLVPVPPNQHDRDARQLAHEEAGRGGQLVRHRQ